VVLKRLLAVENSNASRITLSRALRQFSDYLPRAVCNRAEGRNATSLEEEQQLKTSERTKSSLRQLVTTSERSLWEIKLAHRPKSFWYPYHTLGNVGVLERLLASAGLDLMQLCRGPHGKIADIGAADGDLAFLLEKMGLAADLIDNEPTNFNHLEGARILKEALGSNVGIRTVDLDSQFTLSGENYDAIFLLGVLYHLKNPFFVLEKLAAMARYCFLSTRIARQTHNGQPISPGPIAYLLGPQECNNDSTNFWIFSGEGLKRLIDRTGWDLVSSLSVGATGNSTPADPERDERAFCLLRSKIVPTVSAWPNPVPAHKETVQTMISWNTATAASGKVYVAIDGRQESLFAASRQGSAPANWIRTGCTYEFRLYDSNHSRLLDKVLVATAVP
jgi:2-polyprenyl-3-methyl-5-hydroxy-6-metoxy-1,4-benzoquinol methylase